MTDYTDEEIVQRAKHAERLMGDELLLEAKQRCEELFTREWRASTDEKVQFRAWSKMDALTEVWRVLEAIVREGEYTEEKERLATTRGRR